MTTTLQASESKTNFLLDSYKSHEQQSPDVSADAQ